MYERNCCMVVLTLQKERKDELSSLTMQGSGADCRQERLRREGVDMLPSMESQLWAWCI